MERLPFPEKCMENLAMGKSLEEVARHLREFYHEHGVVPTEDVHAVLGHPNKRVGGPARIKPEDKKK